ncbi:MAG: hypothetical protein JNJ80_26035 [Gemmatimonadetes bacterium]|nr:hypothetical protein [Gemmatimonadota bacterium]
MTTIRRRRRCAPASAIMHEIFRYWNGWRLRGPDYPSSQSFQEGINEYMANLALASSGMSDPDEFYG